MNSSLKIILSLAMLAVMRLSLAQAQQAVIDDATKDPNALIVPRFVDQSGRADRMPFNAFNSLQPQSAGAGSWIVLQIPSAGGNGSAFQNYLYSASLFPGTGIGFVAGTLRHDPQVNTYTGLAYQVNSQTQTATQLHVYNNPAWTGTIFQNVSASSTTNIALAGYGVTNSQWYMNAQLSNGVTTQVVPCTSPGTNRNMLGDAKTFGPNSTVWVGTYNNKMGGSATPPQTYVAYSRSPTNCVQISSPNPNRNGSEFFAVDGPSINDLFIVGLQGNANSYTPLCYRLQNLTTTPMFTQVTCPTGPGSYQGEELVSVSHITGYALADGFSLGGSGNYAMLNDYCTGLSCAYEYPVQAGFSSVLRAWGVSMVNSTLAYQVAENQGSCVFAVWNGPQSDETPWSAIPCPSISGEDYNVFFGVSASSNLVLTAGSINYSTQTGSGPLQSFVAFYNPGNLQ